MHEDSFGNIIGKGENTTVKILSELLHLPILKYPRDYPSSGIYRQFPLIKLIDKTKIFYKLESWHVKHKVDILIIKDQRKIVVRVQGYGHDSGRGHQHLQKQQRDLVQSWLIQTSNIDVVNVIERECKQIFKEKYNDKSIQELKDSFKTSNVLLQGITNASN